MLLRSRRYHVTFASPFPHFLLTFSSPAVNLSSSAKHVRLSALRYRLAVKKEELPDRAALSYHY
jgi:hypothetical protein